jgi:hypothetical protein
MDPVELFVSRNLLFETGRNQFYKNIVFVSREDKDYLKILGRGMFDGFDRTIMTEIVDLKKTSYLCKTLSQESQFQMEDYKSAYWNSKDDYINEEFENGKIIEATVDERFWRGAGAAYKAQLHPENVIIYFPVLESWIHYILPKMENETFETREIIKCVSIPVEGWKKRRKLLLEVFNHNLIEKA